VPGGKKGKVFLSNKSVESCRSGNTHQEQGQGGNLNTRQTTLQQGEGKNKGRGWKIGDEGNIFRDLKKPRKERMRIRPDAGRAVGRGKSSQAKTNSAPRKCNQTARENRMAQHTDFRRRIERKRGAEGGTSKQNRGRTKETGARKQKKTAPGKSKKGD